MRYIIPIDLINAILVAKYFIKYVYRWYALTTCRIHISQWYVLCSVVDGCCLFNTKKGEELKVPYHASATVTHNGNLPPIAMQYILATLGVL